MLFSGIAVGTAALVIALSLMTGFQQDFRERILKGSAHLTAFAPSYGEVLEDAEAVRATLRAVDGVLDAAPVLTSPAMLGGRDRAAPAYAEIRGVDPEVYSVVADRGESFVEAIERLEDGEGRDGIVLGLGLARRLDLLEGDPVRVVLPKVRLSPFGPLPRTRTLTVVGTFTSEFLQQDSQLAFIHLAAAERMLKQPGAASYLELRVEDPDRIDEVQARIETAVGNGLYLVNWLEYNADLLRALNVEKLMLFLAIGLILLVAGMNILSTLMLMVATKVREIGILTAMGAGARNVGRIFMWQGAILGLAGSAFGLTLGFAVAWAIDRWRLIPLDPEVYYLSYVPFAPRASDAAVVAVLAFAVCLAATLYPAWKAARLAPVEALRHE
ncbi:MAG: ABC transporter permease [Planctomycetota bacterium]|nr:ABC transporter permease [Planctomycetota bacterium]